MSALTLSLCLDQLGLGGLSSFGVVSIWTGKGCGGRGRGLCCGSDGVAVAFGRPPDGGDGETRISCGESLRL
jgi:hypothetical protein